MTLDLFICMCVSMLVAMAFEEREAYGQSLLWYVLAICWGIACVVEEFL